MKAIVFLDGQIAEGYGNLKYDGVLAFTKEAKSSTCIYHTNARKMCFAPKNYRRKGKKVILKAKHCY